MLGKQFGLGRWRIVVVNSASTPILDVGTVAHDNIVDFDGGFWNLYEAGYISD